MVKVIIFVIIILLIFALLDRYDDYCYMKQENRHLHRFIYKNFQLQSDSLDACREMLQAACQEDGFWEQEDAEIVEEYEEE